MALVILIIFERGMVINQKHRLNNTRNMRSKQLLPNFVMHHLRCQSRGEDTCEKS